MIATELFYTALGNRDNYCRDAFPRCLRSDKQLMKSEQVLKVYSGRKNVKLHTITVVTQ